MNEYLEWLKTLVGANNSQIYNPFFNVGINMEFIPIVPNDDNRANDGLSLRVMFHNETDIDITNEIIVGCSMIEMIIGMVLRIEYLMADVGDIELYYNEIFNRLMENLGIVEILPEDNIKRVLRRLNARTYSRYGVGGLFPVKKSPGVPDQRDVELWYQMMRWFNENLKIY